MSNNTPALDLSGEELDLLVTAVAAYQHNENFRPLHLKLCKFRHMKLRLDLKLPNNTLDHHAHIKQNCRLPSDLSQPLISEVFDPKV